jgi:hypothetical protein
MGKMTGLWSLVLLAAAAAPVPTSRSAHSGTKEEFVTELKLFCKAVRGAT